MTPVEKNRKPAPYKEKGAAKVKAIKFVVTPDEYKALEILAQDWEISMAQAVRTMIGVSNILSVAQPIFSIPEVAKVMKENGVEPSLLDWRLTTLKRFHKYWDVKPKEQEAKPIVLGNTLKS